MRELFIEGRSMDQIRGASQNHGHLDWLCMAHRGPEQRLVSDFADRQADSSHEVSSDLRAAAHMNSF